MSGTTFEIGDRVLVSAEADDVYFGGEVEGVVVDGEASEEYLAEKRVNVRARDLDYGGMLTQYVRPEDLTLITNDN